jgi:hypothetical protein
LARPDDMIDLLRDIGNGGLIGSGRHSPSSCEKISFRLNGLHQSI